MDVALQRRCLAFVRGIVRDIRTTVNRGWCLRLTGRPTVVACRGVLVAWLIVAASCTSAHAAPFWKRSSFWWDSSLVCLGGAHAADVASTATVLALNRGYEANILLAKFKDPTHAGAAKGSLAAGSMLLSKELHERKPHTAIALNFIACGGLGYVANRNASIYRGYRR